MSEKLTPEEVAKLDPFGVRKIPASEELRELLKEGRMTEEKSESPVDIALAKEIVETDFLGEEAVRRMERKLKSVGVNVEFILDGLQPYFFNKTDLEIITQNGEMTVVRPENMILDGRKVPLTLIALKRLFQKDPMDPRKAIFSSQDWYEKEDFTTKPGEIKLTWAIVTKEVLPDSTKKSWYEQEELLRQYGHSLLVEKALHPRVKRRTATEVVWDILLYYTTTGKFLLQNNYDWTSTDYSCGIPVAVGVSSSGQISLDYLDLRDMHHDFSYRHVGVCSCR